MALLGIKRNLRTKLRRNFSQVISLCRMQRALLEDVLNCFQLTTLAIIISLVDAPHLEILSKGAMTCVELK
jgi:hypothetical protein